MTRSFLSFIFIALIVLLSSCSDECVGVMGQTCGGGEPDADYEADAATDDYFETAPEDISSDNPDFFGNYPDSANPQQIKALKRVNEYRKMVGLPFVDMHEAINLATHAHAEYFVKNYDKYESTGLSPHEEDPDWDGFTGENFWDRMQHFGYEGMGGFEIMAFVNSPIKAVDEWMATLYHRIPIIHPMSKDVGYGGAYSSYTQTRADVMDFGIGYKVVGVDEVIYPPDNAENIPKSWNGYESPQPPPPPGGYPSGPIITLHLLSKIAFIVNTHQLLENESADIPHVFLAPYENKDLGIKKDPYNTSKEPIFTMYSNDPLKAKTKYRVIIGGKIGSKDYKKEWVFTTGY
ncbi:MAG: CAP domain-containing protein [Deltaproteobacteria bacterium]|nr:CAP domain-containing protein [Deltaproteobacteria bacterium]